ncbi:Uncharacterised protein [Mycobacteroides abscessus subsp. abscessus]|jgi:hypothetical protein|uniref:hypothetical protein n=1 Tax=Staphylococcus TaxID=1279 RepID=UPI00091D05D5|nr:MULTISPECIES: hypothetical protein [Staphylococcus]SKR84493.1 Uncharacterised protein [Mycobacteroides abscessus subsp. abscessus]MCG9807231.1 hypothetical protein [Staphylococcus argenteus]MCG9816828.1 hypothetical protein [Staphylococcus argenteus]MDI1992639.1 hypothetical protein [Staphylococcus aureus]MDI2003301.1 hypothetical protein [Staphylococcus aureus]
MRIVRKTIATFLSFIIDIFSNTWISSMIDMLFLDKLYHKDKKYQKGKKHH